MSHPVGNRIRFAPYDMGEYEIVAVYLEDAATGRRQEVGLMHYPSQGQVIGDERRSVQNAKLLNEAAEPLNRKLAELTGIPE